MLSACAEDRARRFTRQTSSSPRFTKSNASPISPAASPRCCVSPNPRRPSAFSPKHFTRPLSSNAHVEYRIVAMSTTRSGRQNASVPKSTIVSCSSYGTPSRSAKVRAAEGPAPIAPIKFLPQHFSSCVSSTAQKCSNPADSFNARFPSPRYRKGNASPISPAAFPTYDFSINELVPRPSCP